MKRITLFLSVLAFAGSSFAASFTITIPDEHVTDIISTLSKRWNYQDKINQNGQIIDNPETRGQFVQRYIREFIRDSYKAQKGIEALIEARNLAQDAAGSRFDEN